MRDVRNKLVPNNRLRRRIALMALIGAASPTIGAEPNPYLNAFLPLPLQANAGSSGTRTNPFCEPTLAAKPATKTVNDAVVLASGSDASVIRLVPIGNAIGLHPIDQPKLVREGRAAITIETPPAANVQSNPMIQSQHHPVAGNGGLVAVPSPVVAPEGARLPENAFERQAKQSVASEFAESLRGGPTSRGVSVQSIHPPAIVLTGRKLVAEPSAPETSPAEALQPEMDQPEPSQSVDSEPIFFSMSDEGDSISDLLDAENDVISNDAHDEDAADRDVEFDDADGHQMASVEPESLMVEPTLIHPVTIDDDSAPLTAMDFADESSEPIVAQQRRSPIVRPVPSPAEMSPQTALSAKRYRPPVAVTNVPIAFDRQSDVLDTAHRSASAARSVVEVSEIESFADAIDEIDEAKSAKVAVASTVSSSNLTPLYMTRAQVRSLTFGGKVTDIEVSDKAVCQAFSAGPNQLKLIGTGDGVTRLVVWAVPDKKFNASMNGSEGEANATESDVDQETMTDVDAPQPVMRAFEIHVTDAVDATGEDSIDHTVMLNQSIRQAFPEADVVVHQRNNRLIVSGRCGSEATATKILRMVRKTCLIPVQDELVVR